MTSSLPEPPVIVLFRRDLRIADNGALAAAANTGRPVLPLFILDEESHGERRLGAASKWWLHCSLDSFRTRVAKLGADLHLAQGSGNAIVDKAIRASGADTIFWNRRYDPAGIAADRALKRDLRGQGLRVESFDGALLHEPSQVKTGSGGFYKVFTPFWRRLRSFSELRDPVSAPASLRGWSGAFKSVDLEALDLFPRGPDWSAGLAQSWMPGEEGARRRLETFLLTALDHYRQGRDLPGKDATSRLSPHLAFGEITPYQILAALNPLRLFSAHSAGLETFERELLWREFCYHLLFHNPELHRRNFRPDFDRFEWRHDAHAMRAWQRGLTGYPIVDGGMRELWRTGWMHNRVRMIVASFLIKDLGIDWREGEAWFWDTLVDADAANNPANWQWVTGSGADAAPYFRVFNPVLQGEKFDPQGDYVRRNVPELASLPDSYIHSPWKAPEKVLEQAHVKLGETYPRPVVDHARARKSALGAYKKWLHGNKKHGAP
ncbi:MAG: deoxyribodipyrimidine photo-lyase [Nitrosospira sp.]